ncbi:DUF427 domain-containing protein [Frigidibacter sp. ROC022]|uniref:DUF427 domain-containing protein n=1 Tax=Frigidibacter sp. ROC022 TaxID=2971796 RepID=UPI00215AD76D|nr:DUF427 domain-containing protein [Frigidibacter sp. ROC022]MCR8725146.1 DUF427 domain-containing protein [Frigidibacter sp. ROC022]
MADHITITPAGGQWVVRALGAVLGESRNALSLAEGDLAPVIYFPRDDMAMAFFGKTDKTTTDPRKGEATYYSIHGKSGVLENVAWSYETPKPGMEAIAGHLAFAADKVTVEKV